MRVPAWANRRNAPCDTGGTITKRGGARTSCGRRENVNVALNIDLGADILGSDGEKLGVVDSLVVDPTTGAVHSVVVRSGLFFPTDRIISAHLIQSISEDGIVVSMSSD